MLINSLFLASLCTWRDGSTENGISITCWKVLLAILVIWLSVLTQLIITCPTNWFFNFFFLPATEAQHVFWPSDYPMQQRLQFFWNHKSLEPSLQKPFYLFQEFVSNWFGSLKDGVKIVLWVNKVNNCSCRNVGQTVSLVDFLLKVD